MPCAEFNDLLPPRLNANGLQTEIGYNLLYSNAVLHMTEKVNLLKDLNKSPKCAML